MRDSVDECAFWMSVTSCMRLVKGVLGGVVGWMTVIFIVSFGSFLVQGGSAD